MSAAERIYAHAQDLLTLAHRCTDEHSAAHIRRIAHSLLELAYQCDGVMDVRAAAVG